MGGEGQSKGRRCWPAMAAWACGSAGLPVCWSAGAWPRAVDGSRGREYDGATDEQGKEYPRGGAGRAASRRRACTVYISYDQKE